MTTHDTLEADYYDWLRTPEPSLPTMDPQVILDANIEETVWLYNYEDETEQWLIYHGEPMERVA